MKPYTQKERASLRRQWRAEFGARNPEVLAGKRNWDDHGNDPITVVGPRGYCDLHPDGAVVTYGVCQWIFDG